MTRVGAPALAPPAPLEFVPGDRPDWDGARTRRFALRTPQGEFVQGCRSLTVDGWRFHQVDYPYEGLLALLDGENWKFLDAIGIQVRLGGDVLDLLDAPVSVDPVSCRARHASPLGTWEVGWYLAPHAGQSGAILEMNVVAPPDLPAGVTLHVLPVFDIRHMYGTSAQDGYDVEIMPAGEVVVAHGGPGLAMRAEAAARFKVRLARVPLFCRMGSGFRYLGPDGVKFQSEERLGQVVGEWIFSPGPGETRLAFAAHGCAGEALSLLDAAPGPEAREAERRAYREAASLAAARGADLPGVAERIFVMAHKFGMRCLESGAVLPEAGGWWFRTPWFRDLFEGLLANWRTLAALGHGDRVGAACAVAAGLIDPRSGRVPNRIPERREDCAPLRDAGRLPDSCYHSSDATTLLFALLADAGAALGIAPEPFLPAFRLAFEAFSLASPDTPDGTAVLGPEGLLRSVPWHSWTDGKRAVSFAGVTVADLPIRVPRAWQIEDLVAGRTAGEVYREQILPTYLLPEINAQWIRMLEWGMAALPATDPLRGRVADVLSKARVAYRPTFWNASGGFLYNLIRGDGRVDDVPGSPGLVAAVLLMDSGVLDDEDLRRIWDTAESRLAVRRGGDLFGILVKASEERVYLGDAQYHEAVIWPRDGAYVSRLLRRLGRHEALRGLLAANLAHQQDEGVLFYNHELFSLAEGKNPSPQPETAGFPVPVKNPMQWWSQWCDAYLDDEGL